MNGGDGMNRWSSPQHRLTSWSPVGSSWGNHRHNISMLDDLTALRAELERLRSELSLARAEVTAKTESCQQHGAARDCRRGPPGDYEQSAGECKELYAAYQVEKELAPEAEARPSLGRFRRDRRRWHPGVHLPDEPCSGSFSDSWDASRDREAAATRAPT